MPAAPRLGGVEGRDAGAAPCTIVPVFESDFAAGGATAPGEGGATPIIVAFASDFLGATAAGMGTAGAGAGFGTGAAAGDGIRGATPGGAFIINIVPLNLGATAPLILKPHFWHFALLSSFCVPQFGQNTQVPPVDPIRHALLRSRRSVHCAGMLLKGTRRANPHLDGGWGMQAWWSFT